MIGLYTQTTTFYSARVTLPPSKNRDHPNCYLLEFKDDNGAFMGTPELVMHCPKEFVLSPPQKS